MHTPGEHLVWSKNSCGLSLVVFQESTQPFATLNWALTLSALAGRRKEQDIALPLMIPLVMVMFTILFQHVPESALPQNRINCDRPFALTDRTRRFA